MKKTKFVLETAPNSRINMYPLRQMLGHWEELAMKVERIVKPNNEELILWRLTYNFYKLTPKDHDDDDVREPQPLVYGVVTLVSSENNWELGAYPYTIEFSFPGFMVYNRDKNAKGGLFLSLPDEEVPQHIENFLRNKIS